MKKKSYKRNKASIVIFFIIMIVMFITTFVTMISGGVPFTLPVFLVVPTVIIGVIVYAFVHNISNKKMMENEPGIRVKYVDTVYRKEYWKNSDPSHNTKEYVDVIVEDEKGQKYCIDLLACNATRAVGPKEIEILAGVGFVNDKNFIKVEEGHGATLWIKSEIIDALEVFEGNKIKYFGRKVLFIPASEYKGEWGVLANSNKKYDLSILKQSMFVEGHLEFDSYQNGKIQRKENE